MTCPLPGHATAALAVVYPSVARRRCWGHKLRNVAAKLPRRLPAACLGEGASIYGALTECVARQAFREVHRRVRPRTCFANPTSCHRIVYAVVTHLNTDWELDPLTGFTQKA